MDKYTQIQNRYRAIGLDKKSYQVSENNHVMAIFGLDIDKDVKGLDLLSSNDKEFVIKNGIYALLNSGGLLVREQFIVTKVEKIESKFKLWTLSGYSWLYSDGSIG